MRTIAVVAMLAFAALARAEGSDAWRWTRTDLALELGYTGLHVADWGQTLDIVRRQDEENWIETNPILGRRPSEARVHGYMIATLVAHWGITAALPRPYRTLWQSFTIGWDGALVLRNWRMGIRVAF